MYNILWRGRAVVARGPHKAEVTGANPVSATYDNERLGIPGRFYFISCIIYI